MSIPPEQAYERLRQAYAIFLTKISPLINEIEIRTGNYPSLVMVELRNFLTHLARCSNPPNSPEELVGYVNQDDYFQKNLEKGTRHLLRAELDCYKILIFLFEEILHTSFDKYTRYVPLDKVADGNFYLPFRRKRAEALSVYTEAKNIETVNPDRAVSEYQRCYLLYRDTLDFYNEYKDGIDYTVRTSRIATFGRRYILNPMYGASVFILGLLASKLFDVAWAEKFTEWVKTLINSE